MSSRNYYDPSLDDDCSADGSRPEKRPRNFIARQACQNCRAKKTRCDEDLPCNFCRTIGIECVYTERRPSKNEASLSAVFSILRRIEAKLDQVSQPTARHILEPSTSGSYHYHLMEDPNRWGASTFYNSLDSPQHVGAGHQTTFPTLSSLSFSAHYTVHWPGMQGLLPRCLAEIISGTDKSYPTRLELARPLMPYDIRRHECAVPDNWLASLSISSIKQLSNAYFDTFNRIYPFLDRDGYFLNTLAMVVQDGFGYDVESCLVLNVMALGYSGSKAFEEGGFEALSYANTLLKESGEMEENTSGLTFFNEARRRFGFCLTERNIQSGQYYLTSAIFYAQAMRPVDQWMMTNNTANICAAFWKCHPYPLDDWLADMQSRLFWSAILLEAVVVQELELPPSSLQDWTNVVPLPTFTNSPQHNIRRFRDPNDSYYHYHFLAQIAQRIILSRIRDELFNDNPSPALARELRQQHEQWRENLPETIRLNDDLEETSFDCPANAVAIAFLQTRYRVAIFHIGRPFLCRAIQDPSSLTSRDLEICSEALRHAMHWGLTWATCVKMENFMPLRFFACGQMFGQLFLFHALARSKSDRVKNLLPAGFNEWCAKMLDFLAQTAIDSPTVAEDLKLLRLLHSSPEKGPVERRESQTINLVE